MNNSAVSILDLGFKYPGQNSNFINNLGLEITEGERFGLFGPNGAGKTTLIHCITGLPAGKYPSFRPRSKNRQENDQ